MKKGLLNCRCTTMNMIMPSNKEFTNTFIPKKWKGAYNKFHGGYRCGVEGNYIWTDGTNVYYTCLEEHRSGGYIGNDGLHLVLNGDTWEQASMDFNEIYFNPRGVWTDGTNIYHSASTWEYILGEEINHCFNYVLQDGKWIPKIWNGTTDFMNTNNFNGNKFWSYGESVRCTVDGSTYFLNGDTWEKKTWDGDFEPYQGEGIWSDGTSIYYGLSDGYSYVLSNNTWVSTTWNLTELGCTNPSVNRIWSDGTNIYYSQYNHQFRLNGNKWEPIEWTGMSALSKDEFYSNDIWTDGKNIYTSKTCYDSETGLDVPIHEVLVPTKAKMFTRTNGEWVSTEAVAHSAYNYSTSNRFGCCLKSKIDKPTDEQISKFVNNEIALIPTDVEALFGIVSLEYGPLFAEAGLDCNVLYVRTPIIALGYSQGVTLYYLWEDGISQFKTLLEQIGFDASVITGEGWYSFVDSPEPVSDSDLRLVNMEHMLAQVVPYGDYLYSIFDFCQIDSSLPASTTIYTSTDVDAIYLLTRDKVCKNDITIVNRETANIASVCYEDGRNVDVQDYTIEYEKFSQFQVDIVSDTDINSINFSYYILGYDYFNGHLRKLDGIFNRNGNTFTCLASRDSVFGIGFEFFNDTHKIKNIYTNAKVVEQNDSKVYLSGLPHSTHVVIELVTNE